MATPAEIAREQLRRRYEQLFGRPYVCVYENRGVCNRCAIAPECALGAHEWHNKDDAEGPEVSEDPEEAEEQIRFQTLLLRADFERSLYRDRDWEP